MKSELIKTEKTVQTPKMDWSIPNQLVKCKDTYGTVILVTTGKHNDIGGTFEGIVLYSMSDSFKSVMVEDGFSKEAFHLVPSDEEITITFKN